MQHKNRRKTDFYLADSFVESNNTSINSTQQTHDHLNKRSLEDSYNNSLTVPNKLKVRTYSQPSLRHGNLINNMNSDILPSHTRNYSLLPHLKPTTDNSTTKQKNSPLSRLLVSHTEVDEPKSQEKAAYQNSQSLTNTSYYEEVIKERKPNSSTSKFFNLLKTKDTNPQDDSQLVTLPDNEDSLDTEGKNYRQSIILKPEEIPVYKWKDNFGIYLGFVHNSNDTSSLEGFRKKLKAKASPSRRKGFKQGEHLDAKNFSSEVAKNISLDTSDVHSKLSSPKGIRKQSKLPEIVLHSLNGSRSLDKKSSFATKHPPKQDSDNKERFLIGRPDILSTNLNRNELTSPDNIDSLHRKVSKNSILNNSVLSENSLRSPVLHYEKEFTATSAKK